MFFKILNVIFYSYESHSIYFTLVILHLISPPLTFKFLVCLIKWVGIFMVLNPVVFKTLISVYHKIHLIQTKILSDDS